MSKRCYKTQSGNKMNISVLYVYNLTVIFSERRQFWLSWDYRTIRVGLGERGQQEFMKMPGVYYQIHVLSLSTGSETMGTWEFERKLGNKAIKS